MTFPDVQYRSSQLLCYTLDQDNFLKLQDIIQVSGNVLDLAGIESTGSVAVAVDTVRESGSTNTWKDSLETPQTLVECFQFSKSKLVPAENSIAVNINSTGTADLPASLDAKQKKALDDSLYILGNLRKKPIDE